MMAITTLLLNEYRAYHMITKEKITEDLQQFITFDDVIHPPRFTLLKKVSTTQDPQQLIDAVENFSAKIEIHFAGLTKENIKDEPTLQNITKVLNLTTGLYELLLNHRSQLKLSNGEPLLINVDSYEYIQYLITLHEEKIIIRFSNLERYDLLTIHCTAMLKLHIFLHNYCSTLENSTIKHISRIPSILDMYLALSKAAMKLNHFDHAEHYYSNIKKILSFLSPEQGLFKLSAQSSYFIDMARISIQKNNYLKAKEYALKHCHTVNALQNANHVIDPHAYQVFTNFMQQAYRQGKFKESFFWSNRAIELVNHAILFFKKSSELKIKVLAQVLKIDYEYEKSKYESSLKAINGIRHTCKQKILANNLEQIQNIIKEHNQSIQQQYEQYLKITILNETANILPNAPDIITIQLNAIEILSLRRSLIKNNIVCNYDQNSSNLIIYNSTRFNGHAFKNALRFWQNHIRQKYYQPPSTPSSQHKCETPPNTVASTTNQMSDPIFLDELPFEKPIVIKRKHLPTSSNVSPQTSEQNVETKLISWGNQYPTYYHGSNTIFKLNGDVKRHYLRINPDLLTEISEKNPDAAKNLIRLCDRGKQIQNSKGNKGFVVVDDKLKGKDASKPYRFYGNKVAVVTDENNHTHTLMEINRWTANKKQKVPTAALIPPVTKMRQP